MMHLRPVGGTHMRTLCQSCGGSHQQFDDRYFFVRFGDPNLDEKLCSTCVDLTWGAGIGDYAPVESEETLLTKLAEYSHSFDLRWRADMRAIKRWQAQTGRELTWPDHADLVVWLLAQLEAPTEQQLLLTLLEKIDARWAAALRVCEFSPLGPSSEYSALSAIRAHVINAHVIWNKEVGVKEVEG